MTPLRPDVVADLEQENARLQAVIAIENARLFDEVQARTKELASTTCVPPEIAWCRPKGSPRSASSAPA